MRCNLLLALATVASLLLSGCRSDIYLHYPRGSNNRLNETSAARSNANRLFDSQNNNRGGYNVGEFGAGQFDEKYFYGSGGDSHLSVEWTMQHGCRDGRQGCRIVVQAMCQPLAGADSDTLRNGNSTQTQGFQAPAAAVDETVDNFLARKAASATADRGLHEPFEWYDACNARERNRGLFTADQRLQGDSAIYTRQNPAGTRRGYECPEERDYYPYWHPTPWLDVAVLTDNAAECPALVAASVAPVHACVRTFAADSRRRLWAVPENNEFDCAKHGGTFLAFHPYLEVASAIDSEAACSARGYRWAVPHRHRLPSLQPACLVPPPPLDCRLASATRDNHLGDKLGGGPVAYDWRLPNFPSGEAQRCVLRLRYNLTSSDSEPNIKQNPLVQPGLQLAVNTNQIGRVFQDRSHVFQLLRVPVPVPGELHHVGVRGKRGNIVQVYPAVEYDFSPTRLSARVGDHVFLQWSGSNSHNNGAPAGDGQAGDDGAGASGTDRSNLAEAGHSNDNLPLPWEAAGFLSGGSGRMVWAWHGQLDGLTPRDFGLALASAGYYRCFAAATCGADSEESKTPLDVELNAAPASFPGLLIRLDKAGQFKFVCTRNNNFSNSYKLGLDTAALAKDRGLCTKNSGVVHKELCLVEWKHNQRKRAWDHLHSSLDCFSEAWRQATLWTESAGDEGKRWRERFVQHYPEDLLCMYSLTLNLETDQALVDNLGRVCDVIGRYNFKDVEYLEVTASIFIDYANRLLRLSVSLDKTLYYGLAYSYVAMMLFPIREADRILNRNSTTAFDCLHRELDTLREDQRIQETVFHCRVELERGKSFWQNLGENGEKQMMDEALLGMDHMRAALNLISADGIDIVLEAEVCSSIGSLYLNIFKAESSAEKFFKRCIQLVLCHLTGESEIGCRSESWFATAERGLRTLQERGAKRHDEALRQALESDGTLADIRTNFECGIEHFLKHIYKVYPQGDSKLPDPDQSLRKRLLVALAHYHPDKADKSDRRQYYLREEITKYLNVRFEQTK